VLAGEEPALAVAGEAIRLVGRLAKDADLPGFLIPAGDAVERSIGPKQVSAVAKPDGPSAQRIPVASRSIPALLSLYFAKLG